jgi:hypothetical protein
MDGCFDACSLPNVCGAIDGSHISLSQMLNKQVITILTNYSYTWKNCNSTFLQVISNMDKLFWNICCSVHCGTIDGGKVKVSFIYEQFQTQSILKANCDG